MSDRVNLLNPPPYEPNFVFDHLTTLMLQACGHIDVHAGAGLTLPVAISCVTRAADHWPQSHLATWAAALKTDGQQLKRLKINTPKVAVHLFLRPPTPSDVMESVQSWTANLDLSSEEAQLDALLGRGLVIAAQSGRQVSKDLVGGLATLKLAIRGKGRRSADWQRLLVTDLRALDLVVALTDTLGPDSPCRPLLTQLSIVLQTAVALPKTMVVHAQSESSAETSVKTAGEYMALIRSSLQPVSATSQARSPFASVAARLAEANHSTPAEKLGIHSRDYLLLDDLTRITRQLTHHIHSADPAGKAHAMLALLCLVTATSDYQVINMPLAATRDGMWLDLANGCWSWDFASYRHGHAEGDEHSPEPVRVPLPSPLAQALINAQRQVPAAQCAGDLIQSMLGDTPLRLKDYREALRQLGDTAHPAYQGRFARSMVPTMLHISGSDMLTALATARFACVAPAALFYYAPQDDHIIRQLALVFARLGLGEPTCPQAVKHLGSAAAQCPGDKALRAGWQSLIGTARELHGSALSATTAVAMLAAVNQTMVTLCAGFVIQTAHRATRLDRLTADCLLAHPNMLVILDKDDTTSQGRDRPRALPVLPRVHHLLDMAVDLHLKMGTARQGAKSEVHIDAQTPVFAQFDGDGRAAGSVDTHQIAAVIKSHFLGVKTNFARSIWITQLDQDGADRWLIRALSGHTRDVTRVGDAYFDISVAETCRRLGEAMAKVGQRLFGIHPLPQSSRITRVDNTWPATVADTHIAGKPGIPDPRMLLTPLSGRVINGLTQAERIRSALARGQLQGSPGGLAVLHLLYMDLIPMPDVALTISEPGVVWHEGAPCLQWSRPHFIHPVLYPILPITCHWIQQARQQTPPPTRASLLADVAGLLAEVAPICGAIPAADRMWELAIEWAASFRRVMLPPTLLAASHPGVLAPNLSHLSWLRFSGQTMDESIVAVQEVAPTWRAKARAKRGEDIIALGQILNHWADHDRRLGELRARAIGATSAILGLELVWSPGGIWLRDWLLDELERSRQGIPTRYQVSSLATYYSRLVRGTTEHWQADPCEWDDDDWQGYMRALSSPHAQETGLQEDAVHALAAIVASLRRRGYTVPPCVHTALRGQAQDDCPSDSASSTYISPDDIDRALAIAANWCTDTPLLGKLVTARARLSQWLPLRSSDLSSLTRDCITPSGGLVIRRVGFNNHKTESTIRVVPLSIGQHDRFAHLRTDISLFADPDGDLLLRGKGDADGVQQDNRATALWTQALKVATRDKAARPHSVRAATLEHLAWPGWELAARRLLVGTLSVTDARSAATAWTTSWVGLASASASAGHADIRAALGNYLAAWPIVHAVTSMALLGDLGASAGLVGQLGLSEPAYRQARSRATRTPDQASDKAVNSLSGWDWITTRLEPPKRRASRRPAPPHNAGSASTLTTPCSSVPPATIPRAVQIMYLSFRSLGLPIEQAATRANVPWRVALQLDRQLPPANLMAAATQRTKGASAPRGTVANLAICASPLGDELRAWALSLPLETLEWAMLALIRDMPAPEPHLWHREHDWQALACGLPDALHLRVAIGAAHITLPTRTAALKPNLRYRLISDQKLGARPLVSIWPSDGNRVLAARITATARITVLACMATQGAPHAD